MVVLGAAGSAGGHDSPVTGCSQCHGDFYGAASYQSPTGEKWSNSLHEVHRSATGMGTACEYCHQAGAPSTYKSFGKGGLKGYGCGGCHAQIVTGVPKGYGLRARHAKAGDVSCATCHAADGVPAPESAAPYYYGTAYTKVSGPCNATGKEDWSGNGKGLDNDGDGLVDGLDTDCGACKDLDDDGWQDSTCNPDPLKGGGDCKDSDPFVHPESDDPCDGKDQDCDGKLDEDWAADCDDDLACTVDSCGPAGCTHADTDLLCDDAVLCTDDHCIAGVCHNIQADEACDDDLVCTVDSCGAAGCLHVAMDSKCNDGVACTTDVCTESGCQGLPDDADCQDSDPCTINACDPLIGCTVAPALDLTPCDDGDDVCTGDDACSGGVCMGQKLLCDCLADSDCLPYDDGDPCNGTLECKDAGGKMACAVDPASIIACSQDNVPPCTQYVCDPGSGECVLLSAADDSTCDLASACVQEARCKAGSCEPIELLSCDDGNLCTADSCDWEAGCLHEPNAAPCDDGNPCTEDDQCALGSCGGTPIEGCCLSDEDCPAGRCESGVCVEETSPEGSPEMPADSITQPETGAPEGGVESAAGEVRSGEPALPESTGEVAGAEAAADEEQEGSTLQPVGKRKVCEPRSSCSASPTAGASGAAEHAGLLLAAAWLLIGARRAWWRTGRPPTSGARR
jgi:hypothetical protein